MGEERDAVFRPDCRQDPVRWECHFSATLGVPGHNRLLGIMMRSLCLWRTSAGERVGLSDVGFTTFLLWLVHVRFLPVCNRKLRPLPPSPLENLRDVYCSSEADMCL